MTDLLDRLRLEDPCADAAPGADSARRMDAALEELFKTPAPAPARGRGRGRHGLLSTPPRRIAAGAALATGAAVLVVAAGLPGARDSTVAPAPASAATVLGDLAGRAAGADAGSGRYAHLKTLAYVSHMSPKGDGKTRVAVVPHESEEWLDADGSGVSRVTMRTDRVTFPDPADAEGYDPSRPTGWDGTPRAVKDIAVLDLTPAMVRELPEDPAALGRRLAEPLIGFGDFGGERAVVARSAQLLASPLTPPAVRSALFTVLRELPGARLIGDLTDPLGRAGVAIEFVSGSWKTVFLFDKGSAALLGTRSTGSAEVPGRDIEDWNLILESDRTDEAPAARAEDPAIAPGPLRLGGRRAERATPAG